MGKRWKNKAKGDRWIEVELLTCSALCYFRRGIVTSNRRARAGFACFADVSDVDEAQGLLIYLQIKELTHGSRLEGLATGQGAPQTVGGGEQQHVLNGGSGRQYSFGGGNVGVVIADSHDNQKQPGGAKGFFTGLCAGLVVGLGVAFKQGGDKSVAQIAASGFGDLDQAPRQELVVVRRGCGSFQNVVFLSSIGAGTAQTLGQGGAAALNQVRSPLGRFGGWGLHAETMAGESGLEHPPLELCHEASAWRSLPLR